MVVLSKKKFKKALPGSGGNQSVIATKLGMDRSNISHFLSKHPDMRELVETEAERIIDVAENVVDKKIIDGDTKTSKWKLLNSKRGKARGYGPKIEQEVTGQIDNKLQVEIIRIQKKEEEDSEEPLES